MADKVRQKKTTTKQRQKSISIAHPILSMTPIVPVCQCAPPVSASHR